MPNTSDAVRTMYEHHFWATRTLIDHLERLPAERLDEVPDLDGWTYWDEGARRT